MSTRKIDKTFLVMLAVTIALVAAVFYNNSMNALHPERSGGPRIDVGRVVERIEKAGLEPREAMYYRVME